ncbi:hypothetical protein ACFL4T_08130 [candidate division KSB1 bacterium]
MKKIIILLLGTALFYCGKGSTEPDNITYSGINIAMDVETSYTAGYNSNRYATGIGPNTNIYVSIYAINVTDLKGYDVRFTFDDTKLEFISASLNVAMIEENILGNSPLGFGKVNSGKSNEIFFAVVSNSGSVTYNSDWKLMGIVQFKTLPDFYSGVTADFIFNFAEFMDTGGESTFGHIDNAHNGAINTTSTQRSVSLTGN